MNTSLSQSAVFLALIIAAADAGTVHAETITLKDGTRISGKILEHNPDHIKVDIGGVPLTFYKDQVESFSPDPIKRDNHPGTAGTTPSETDDPAADLEQTARKASRSVVVIQTTTDKTDLEGTGFFVSADGLIATNLHVVFKAVNIKIWPKDGNTYPVQYIANYDESADFCLLKIDIDNAPALELGDSDKIVAGQKVFTIGHQQGNRYQISSGPLIGKRIAGAEEILLSRMISGSGSSGGPILDLSGKVLGITTSFNSQDGYNLGIPINALKNRMNSNALIRVADFNQQMSPAFELTFIGKGKMLAGDYRQALDLFAQATALDPDHLNAWVASAETYQILQMADDAFNAWQKVQHLAPDNIKARLRLAKIYLDRDMPDDAIQNFTHALGLAPRQSAEVYNDLGFAYGKKGMYAQAIEAYTKAVEIDPRSANGYYNLAVAHFNLQDLTNAKKYCKQAIQHGYNVPESFLTMLDQTR